MKNESEEVVLDKQKELELQISRLQIELKELKRKENEETLKFIELFRDVLFDDSFSIVLQGHAEWQIHKRYHVKDIEFEYRKKIAKSLQEIIREIEND